MLVLDTDHLVEFDEASDAGARLKERLCPPGSDWWRMLVVREGVNNERVRDLVYQYLDENGYLDPNTTLHISEHTYEHSNPRRA